MMTGIGAHRSGGRWNSPGRYVVYASGSLSLAMLEVLVHIDDAEAFRQLPHVYLRVTFPAESVATLTPDALPRGWDARPQSRASQVAGDEWLDRAETPVLAVPSVIVPPALRYDPTHMNYLIDPHHPDYETSIEAGEALDLEWDPRLAGR